MKALCQACIPWVMCLLAAVGAYGSLIILIRIMGGA